MSNNVKNNPAITAENAAGAAEAAALELTQTDGENPVQAAENDDAGVYTTFDFEHLKGRDMVAIENEMQGASEYALAPEISTSFQSKMAARAAGIGSDVLEAMPLKDFNKITGAARRFLLDSGY